MKLWSLPWVSICLAGCLEKVRSPGPQDAGRGCWTSPGEYDICECLSRGEESKDDPVHHPFHLRVERAALAGAWGGLWRFCGEGTLRT